MRSRNCAVEGAGLDNTGNIFFTIGALFSLWSGYELYVNPNDYLAYFAKMVALGLWAAAGLWYIVSDLITWGRHWKRDDDQDYQDIYDDEPESRYAEF
jgi:hypothetical protein